MHQLRRLGMREEALQDGDFNRAKQTKEKGLRANVVSLGMFRGYRWACLGKLQKVFWVMEGGGGGCVVSLGRHLGCVVARCAKVRVLG